MAIPLSLVAISKCGDTRGSGGTILLYLVYSTVKVTQSIRD